MRNAIAILLAGVIVTADQWSKLWVVAEVPLWLRSASWFDFLHLTHTRNRGAAFGLLRDLQISVGSVTLDGVNLLGVVSLLAAVGIAVVFWQVAFMTWGTTLSLGMLMGGAIGNGIDRWAQGYVVDFIHLQYSWFDFPVFNIADIGISLGAVGLALSGLWDAREPLNHGGRAGIAGAD
jgi:signal peptidase II